MPKDRCSLSWFTSTQRPFRNARPSVLCKSSSISSLESGTPSTESEGFSLPSWTERETAEAPRFHQFGTRQTMPHFSMSSTLFKNC